MYIGWRNHVTDREIHTLAREIDDRGYAVINNYLSTKELSDLNSFAERKVDENNGQYVGIRSTEGLNGTVLADVVESEQFLELCKRLSDAGLGKEGPPFNLYQVVRFVKGMNGRRVSGAFHYDSYVLTVLLPLVIPPDGSGNLLLMKASRKIRKWYVTNLVDKFLVENKWRQKWLHWRVRKGEKKIIHLSLQPGNIYFFWGYRSIHTNEPTDPSLLRATALFHYGDPHANSRLRAKIRARRGLDASGGVIVGDRL